MHDQGATLLVEFVQITEDSLCQIRPRRTLDREHTVVRRHATHERDCLRGVVGRIVALHVRHGRKLHFFAGHGDAAGIVDFLDGDL